MRRMSDASRQPLPARSLLVLAMVLTTLWSGMVRAQAAQEDTASAQVTIGNPSSGTPRSATANTLHLVVTRGHVLAHTTFSVGS